MQINDPVLSLRPEGEQDREFLAKLYRSTREDLLLLGLPEAMLDSLVEMQFRAHQSGNRTQFPDARHAIVEKGGVPIGSLVAHYGDDAIRLVYLALLPQERRLGYGRRLIQALQSEAARAHKPLTLSVSAQNWQAQRLYVASGFGFVNSGGANLEMTWLGNNAAHSSAEK